MHAIGVPFPGEMKTLSQQLSEVGCYCRGVVGVSKMLQKLNGIFFSKNEFSLSLPIPTLSFLLQIKGKNTINIIYWLLDFSQAPTGAADVNGLKPEEPDI